MSHPARPAPAASYDPAELAAVRDEADRYGGPHTLDGRAAAAAEAYQVAARTPAAGRERRQQRNVLVVAIVATVMAAAAVLWPTPGWTALPVAAALIAGLVWSATLIRRSAYALDVESVAVLEEAGLDGPACMHALHDVAAEHEPWTARLAVTTPTVAARRRALTAAIGS
jgi:hypothetical protein